MSDIQQAMHKIIEDELEQGFAELADAYAEGQNDPAVLRDLKEGFWKPNLDEMERTFRKNVAFLENYPFLLTKNYVAPADNYRLLFPLTDSLFYCFDQKRQVLTPLIVESERETRYFFKDLDHPLFVESEYNLFNLRFLRDNVRRSEDFAGDNHIYLHYEDSEAFSVLLYYSEIEELCTGEKFVFLIGNEKDLYPLDFKTRFGINYDKMTPQKLRIEEMQRICFWYKRGYSGTDFGLHLLDRNSHIAMKNSADLFMRSYIMGHRFDETNLPEQVIKDISKIYTIQSLISLYHHPDIKWDVDWGGVDFPDFIQWLKDSAMDRFTLPELFRAYFAYKYHKDKPHMNPRVVPVILWEPHINKADIFNPLILDFPYRTVLNSIRDPIITIGRIYQREGSIFITQTLAIGLSMNQELRKDYYGYRLEDAKLHPEETCQAICETLNIPYDPDMLHNDYEEEAGGINGESAVRGFDPAPLYRNVDAVLSPFDQCRLQIFLDSILKHYGYPTFDFEECPMNDNDVAFLFKFPFKFEKEFVEKGKWGKITREQLRQNLFQNMVAVWQMGKRGELVFPKVIKPQVEGSK